MANYEAANFALKAGCGASNELLYDDKGLPSVMVKIPKFKISDVIDGGSDDICPAFNINGHVVDYLYISKYQNVVENGRAYSKPGVDPTVYISWNNAKSYCEAKGKGWHLMTKAEYAMIALWCKKNGFMPYGNNDYGKDASEDVYKAIPAAYGDDGNPTRVLTGSGPLTWSHNGEPDGIWDINGNIHEWCGGMRLVYGEVQIIPNGDAADLSCDQSASSDAWKAIDATTGEFVTPDGSGTTVNTIKLNNNSAAYYDIEVTDVSEDFLLYVGSATCSEAISDAAKTTLRLYGLLGEEGSVAADYGYDRVRANNNSEEAMGSCGGSYTGGSGAGVFYCACNGARPNASLDSRGFRSAYAPLSTD